MMDEETRPPPPPQEAYPDAPAPPPPRGEYEERDYDDDRRRSRSRDRDRRRRGSRRSRSRSRSRSRDRDRRRRHRGSRDRSRERRRRHDDYDDRDHRRRRDERGFSEERGHRPTADDRRRVYEQSSYKSERQWPSTAWDVPPVGYAHLTPMQYKEAVAAGNLPPPMYTADPDPTQKNMPLCARQLVADRLPESTQQLEIASFINEKMLAGKLITQPGPPVVRCELDRDSHSALLEFRSVDEATNCLAFDGDKFKEQEIRLRRPDNYEPPKGYVERVPVAIQTSSNVSGVVQDSPNKIYIGGIPSYLKEEQVKDLLVEFGQLKSFHLVRDSNTGESKGFAFCEYLDPSITDTMIGALNDLRIGEKRLLVQRASVGAKGKQVQKDNPMNAIPAFRSAGLTNMGPPPAMPPMGMMPPPSGPPGPISMAAMPMPPVPTGQAPGQTSGKPALISQPPPRPPMPVGGGPPIPVAPPTSANATKVLVLMNMVTPDELKDDEEYEDICLDIREECEKFGKLDEVKIPRPDKTEPDKEVPGLGKVFLKYSTPEEATKASQALSGRSFAERTVVTTFWSEDKFDAGSFEEE